MRYLVATMLFCSLGFSGSLLAEFQNAVMTIQIAVSIEPEYPVEPGNVSPMAFEDCDTNLYFTEVAGPAGTSYQSGCSPFIAGILLSDSGAESVTLVVAPI